MLPSRPLETSLVSSSLTAREDTVDLCRSRLESSSWVSRSHTVIYPSSYAAYSREDEILIYLTGMFLPGLWRCAIFYAVLRERRKMYWLLAVMSNLPG